MSLPKVYIVILNYRQWQDTRECLESVLSSSYYNFSVLLIDNDSKNNSLEQLAEWLKTVYDRKQAVREKMDYIQLNNVEISNLNRFQQLPKITFIQNATNNGFAAGNNLVLSLLQHEDAYVWLLNPDMVAEKDTLEKLAYFGSQQNNKCIIGTEVRAYAGNQDLLFYGGGKVNFVSGTVKVILKQTAIADLDYISGASLFTHASNFKELGLLPEEYFLYWEETDWCYRAKQNCFGLYVCPGAICYDKISTVIGKDFMAHYYYARNGLLFISKFRKKNIPLVLGIMMIRFLKRSVKGQWGPARGIFRGTLDFFKSKWYEAE